MTPEVDEATGLELKGLRLSANSAASLWVNMPRLGAELLDRNPAVASSSVDAGDDNFTTVMQQLKSSLGS